MLQRDRVLKKSAGCEKNSLSEKFLFWNVVPFEKDCFSTQWITSFGLQVAKCRNRNVRNDDDGDYFTQIKREIALERTNKKSVWIAKYRFLKVSELVKGQLVG